MELEETVEEILPTSVQNNNNISDLVSPVGHRHLSESSLSFTDKNKGWKLVQRRIPDILEYGRKEGILVQKIEVSSNKHSIVPTYKLTSCFVTDTGRYSEKERN